MLFYPVLNHRFLKNISKMIDFLKSRSRFFGVPEKSAGKRSRGKKSPKKWSSEIGPRMPVSHSLAYVGSWDERWVSFDLCGIVGWDQSIKNLKIVQPPSVNFLVIPLTENAFSGTFFTDNHFSGGLFSRALFPGDLFSGTSFFGEFFPRHFSEDHFSGDVFSPRIFYLWICFSRGPFSADLFPRIVFLASWLNLTL